MKIEDPKYLYYITKKKRKVVLPRIHLQEVKHTHPLTTWFIAKLDPKVN